MTKDSEKKETLTSVKARRRNYTKPLVLLVVVVGVGILGYKLWEKPQLLEQAKALLFKNEVKEDVYQPQIDALMQQIRVLQSELSMVKGKAENPDFSDMNKRIDAIEQVNLNTIKSKADMETVLGLVVRMDNAEGKISDLAKVTNKSALALMSAMLVKDAAERGGEFVYEAEVLSEIVKGNIKIAKEMELINKVALTGVSTKENLQNEFADIYGEKYAEVVEEIKPKDWKERIYYQINKIIKIKKVDDEKVKEKFSEEDRAWSVVSDFVSKGEIKRAVAIAKKPLNEEMIKNEKFADWLEKASEYGDFYDAISRISANSLAVMKVEFLKNVK
ncbi:MAG: hypothetical protein IKA30_02305 [Alphaproteobacteria bacterium]|nr:hypothetical protein [Alphaproteobacteria bacterium]